jgi:hypothetical protein
MKRFHVNVSVSDLAEGPAGLAWETFHTLDTLPIYGAVTDTAPKPSGACCVPEATVAAKTCCAGTG